MKGAAFMGTNLTEKKKICFRGMPAIKLFLRATQRGLFSVNYLFGEQILPRIF